jgi:hypothetical protein
MRSPWHHSVQVPVYIINICTRQASNALTRSSAPASVALRPFAADPSVIRQLNVRIARPKPEQLLLEYALQGDLAGVRLPAAAARVPPAAPTDGLWQHTCMEVFVGAAAAGTNPGSYLEFNLAPSGQWAAYRFSGYRAGMAPLTGIRPPRIQLQTRADEMVLHADVELPPDLAPAGLRLGITAVVEKAEGGLSYWALRHAGDRPDFHHPDSFGFEI